MSSPAKLINSFQLFTSREIIKQQRRTNFAIRVFFWAKYSIIIEIRWWWLSVQPVETGQDFQYPERERWRIYYAPELTTPWAWKNWRKTCKGRRESWSCLPWPSIFWVSWLTQLGRDRCSVSVHSLLYRLTVRCISPSEKTWFSSNVLSIVQDWAMNHLSKSGHSSSD